MIFKRLNIDIIINILKYVRPQDIIAFRQTCKSLFQVTLNRTVWLNALRNVIQAHRISKSNYPSELMSTSQLQHAALLPFKFIELLKKSHLRDTLAPLSTRLITCHLPQRQREELRVLDHGFIEDFRVGPGGRYILVRARYESDHGPTDTDVFTVFDLGYCGREYVAPVFRLPMPEDVLKMHMSIWIGFDPVDDGTLFFIIMTFARAPQECLMRAYNANVASNSSTYNFRLCSEFSIPTECVAYRQCFVCPQTATVSISFTFEDTTHLAVWDFKENKRAIWSAPDCSHPEELVLVSSEDTLIVSGTRPEYRTWIFNIPDLLKPSVFQSAPLEASMTIGYSYTHTNTIFGSGRIDTLHGQYTFIQEDAQLVFYRITDIHSHSTGVAIPKKLLVKTDSVSTSVPIYAVDGFYATFCAVPASDGQHVLFGYPHDTPDLHTYGVYVVDLDSSGKVVLAGHHNPGFNATLACTRSLVLMTDCHVSVPAGRYFLLTGDNELYVADYLRPPTS